MWPEEEEAMRLDRDRVFRETGVPAPDNPEGEGVVLGERPPPYRDEDIPPEPDAFLKSLLWRYREDIPWP